MITFTKSAKREIQIILEKHHGFSFRIGIKGNSCEGSLHISIDKQKHEDELHLIDDIPTLINRKHILYIIGTKVSITKKHGKVTFLAKLC